MKFSTIQPGDSRIAGIARRAAPALLALLIAGCAGPPVLERQVLGYDDVTSRLDQKLLLVNIARADNGKPVHFTTTSTIAATFNWTSTLGAGAEWHRNTPDNFLGLLALGMSMGQWLCVPMIVLGAGLWVWLGRQPAPATARAK